MAFVSGVFILFVAVVTVSYFLLKREWRWIALLAGSYVFYWLNSTYLVLVLLFMTITTYIVGEILDKRLKEDATYLKVNKQIASDEKKKYKQKRKNGHKRILLTGVIINLSVLFILKYFNFFAGNANGILKLLGVKENIPFVHWMLPIGLSFYTLQAIAYMTDIYRGKYEADNNVFQFMLFMSFFPQIVQGPIPRYEQLAKWLYEGHDFDYKRFTFGIQLVLWGFMKKLVIADRLAIPVNQIFNEYQEYSGFLMLLGAMGYGLQVYADFSGGMDIARGVSQIWGIELELNFRQPYFSKSIEEFWRRWHITLGAWMRDYIFYPLSLSKGFGNLGKKARKIFGNQIGKKIPPFLAMFVVYFLVGFWHGADWKYIIYGIWNGIFIMSGILLEDVYKSIRSRLGIAEDLFAWKFFQMLRTFVLCSFGRFFSRAESSLAAFAMMGLTFKGFFNFAFLVDGTLIKLGLDTANWILLVIMLVVLLCVDMAHERGVEIRETIAKQGIVFRWIVYYAAFFLVMICGIWGPQYDSTTFIYQQF